MKSNVNVGYACLICGVPEMELRTCTAAHATPEKLRAIIGANIETLARMTEYNARNGIKLFRISSDIIPFGSSPVNTLDWAGEFGEQLEQLGRMIRDASIRVSMHPGQYTVLNSPDPGVVARAVADLEYHARFLDSLGTGTKSKIIIHGGGTYGDKQAAMTRFAENLRLVSPNARDRLALENDERSYDPSDILELRSMTGLPAVYDNLHSELNPGPERGRSHREWIALYARSWHERDGRQKIHYSQQDAAKKNGSHSAGIAADGFKRFCANLDGQEVDMMLEVKDKNISAIKCANLLAEAAGTGRIAALEAEWARHKYAVLEHSPAHYNAIRALLKDKSSFPASKLYEALEQAAALPVTAGTALNAAAHAWGYFKNTAAPAERRAFERLAAALNGSPENVNAAMKRFLGRLALKYRDEYLMNSYYLTF